MVYIYVAMELIPYEGEILKGVFTDLETAKSEAVSNKQADYHIGKVYRMELNTTLPKEVVWRERTPTFDK